MQRRPASTPVTRRRHHKHYKVNIKRLALALLLMSLTAELVWAAFTSPYLYVKNKKVTGNVTVSTSEILGRLAISPKTNIFRVRARNARARLLRNPVISDVELHRSLPSTLIVNVTERTTDFMLSCRGKLYEIDSTDVPFRMAKQVDPHMSIVYCDFSGIVLGKQITDSSFVNASKCLILAREKHIPQVVKIAVDQNGDLCLNVSDGFEIRLGRPERLAEKLGIAAKMLNQYPELRQRGGYINITCVEAPAFKLND